MEHENTWLRAIHVPSRQVHQVNVDLNLVWYGQQGLDNEK